MDNEVFEHTTQHLQEQLKGLQTNRANGAFVEDLLVNAYGSTMRLQEVAAITVPEPQLLVIQPWDKSLLKEVEHTIRMSKLELNPVVDGTIVRISFPALTQEKRESLVKLMNEMCEEARIGIRRNREEILKQLKAQQKNGTISEDDYFRQEKEIQELVDHYNAAIKELGEKKERELLTI